MSSARDQTHVEIWAPPEQLDVAARLLNEFFEEQKRLMSQEILEIPIAGYNRALFCAGALVDGLLLEGEFVQVNFQRLPCGMEENEFAALAASIGEVNSCRLVANSQEAPVPLPITRSVLCHVVYTPF